MSRHKKSHKAENSEKRAEGDSSSSSDERHHLMNDPENRLEHHYVQYQEEPSSHRTAGTGAGTGAGAARQEGDDFVVVVHEEPPAVQVGSSSSNSGAGVQSSSATAVLKQEASLAVMQRILAENERLKQQVALLREQAQQQQQSPRRAATTSSAVRTPSKQAASGGAYQPVGMEDAGSSSDREEDGRQPLMTLNGTHTTTAAAVAQNGHAPQKHMEVDGTATNLPPASTTRAIPPEAVDYNPANTANHRLLSPHRQIQHCDETPSYNDCDDDNPHSLPPVPSAESDVLAEEGGFRYVLVDRASWLVGLLVLQSCSSFILEQNEALLQEHLVIVHFLTMLVGAGGNAGNQACVRVIRGLAVGSLTNSTLPKFLLTELRMALLLSFIIGTAGFLRAAVFSTPLGELVAITATLCFIVITSICMGALLPLAMNWVGIDPAHSCTTIQVAMDIIGVLLTVLVSSAILNTEWGEKHSSHHAVD